MPVPDLPPPPFPGVPAPPRPPAPRTSTMRRVAQSRTALWTAFVLVHVWITAEGVAIVRGSSFWDLDLYRYWMWLGLNEGQWPVLDVPWVYPALALVPMGAVALVVGSTSSLAYALGWCAIVTLLDGVAVHRLTRTGPPVGVRRRDAGPGAVGAWWWLAFLVLLGPVAMGRLDAIVAPIVVVALCLAVSRPGVASALLTVGAWIKVAPGPLLVPLVLAARRPWREVVLPAGAVTLAVVAAVAVGGRLTDVASFLASQGDRGLQIEAVAATPWVVAATVSPAVQRWFNDELVTWEITGPGTTLMIDALAVAFVVAIAAVAALLWWVRHHRGATFWTDDAARHGFVVHGALLMTTALIVTNKVGSPQFIGWLAPPVAVGLALGLRRWRLPAALVAGIAGATQVVFPLAYGGVVSGAPAPTVVLVLRNVALVVLLVLAVRSVARDAAVPAAEPARAGAPGVPTTATAGATTG